MTRREKLIADLKKELDSVTIETIEKVFNLVHARDFAIFCSYMGDYDHPGERVAAEETFKKAIADIEQHSIYPMYVLEGVVNTIEKSDYYNKNFHHMGEDA